MALPRSPAGLLASQLTEEPLSRSTSGISSTSTSASPMAHPGILRRRSTDTSGGLDYYWSAFAGAGANSSSSSLANSLGASPSASAALLASSPAGLGLSGRARSGSNLRDHIAQEPVPALPERPQVQNSRGQTLELGRGLGDMELELESPGGWSGESDYSNDDAHEGGHSRLNGLRGPGTSSSSGHSATSVDYRAIVSDHGEVRRGLLDSSEQSNVAQTATSGQDERWDVRGSITSQSTQGTYRPDRSGGDEEQSQSHDDHDHDPAEKTPVPPVFVERTEKDLRAPAPLSFDKSPKRDYPSRLNAASKQTTPTRPTASPSASGYTPSSGRLPFASPPIEVFRTSPIPGVDVTVPSPQSAPAWKSEFGQVAPIEDGEETIRARGKRTTLPAAVSTPTGSANEAMLSPEKYRAGSPERKRSREPSPGRSPEPPPRSNLRAPYSPGGSMESTTPLNVSPRTRSNDLPTIINTPHSPDNRSPDSDSGPLRPNRSPSRSPSLSTTATINEITDMLGGAFEEMGLTDPRETPTVVVPNDAPRPNGSLASAAEIGTREAPISVPNRGSSLDATMQPPPLPHRPEPVRRIPSGISLRNTTHAPPPVVQSPTTIASLSQRPWPAAMLYGNIKPMKYAGDRAKAYARAINDLARAETGLREWCHASSSSSSSSATARPAPKHSAMAGLGIRSSIQSTASTLTVPLGSSVHGRSVSSSSEFPMRADSYTAREISQRAVDPSDAPGSLPPNLPYPQLQAQYASGGLGSGSMGGMKTSQSMQSVSSFSSSKRSFFGGIGKKSSSKKDGGGTSLGPPSGVGAGMNKKDVRGLPISSPSYGHGHGPAQGAGAGSSPHRSSDGVTSRPSISAPMGPRGPRMGSFTPPPQFASGGAGAHAQEMPARASLDTGLSRMSSIGGARASLDGTQLPRKGSLPPRQSGIGNLGGVGGSVGAGSSSPNPEELRAMGDVLPHVSKAVLKAYLGRYGDQMRAIGMYLEDEKRGKVLKG